MRKKIAILVALMVVTMSFPFASVATEIEQVSEGIVRYKCV